MLSCLSTSLSIIQRGVLLSWTVWVKYRPILLGDAINSKSTCTKSARHETLYLHKILIIIENHHTVINQNEQLTLCTNTGRSLYYASQSIRSQNVHLLSHTNTLTNKRLSNTVISITNRQSNVPTWSLLVSDDGSWVSSDDRRRRCRFTADFLMSRRGDHSTFWLRSIHVGLDSSWVELLLIDAVICRKPGSWKIVSVPFS